MDVWTAFRFLRTMNDVISQLSCYNAKHLYTTCVWGSFNVNIGIELLGTIYIFLIVELWLESHHFRSTVPGMWSLLEFCVLLKRMCILLSLALASPESFLSLSAHQVLQVFFSMLMFCATVLPLPQMKYLFFRGVVPGRSALPLGVVPRPCMYR